MISSMITRRRIGRQNISYTPINQNLVDALYAQQAERAQAQGVEPITADNISARAGYMRMFLSPDEQRQASQAALEFGNTVYWNRQERTQREELRQLESIVASKVRQGLTPQEQTGLLVGSFRRSEQGTRMLDHVARIAYINAYCNHLEQRSNRN